MRSSINYHVMLVMISIRHLRRREVHRCNTVPCSYMCGTFIPSLSTRLVGLAVLCLQKQGIDLASQHLEVNRLFQKL